MACFSPFLSSIKLGMHVGYLLQENDTPTCGTSNSFWCFSVYGKGVISSILRMLSKANNTIILYSPLFYSSSLGYK
jgi:hypothetical protein